MYNPSELHTIEPRIQKQLSGMSDVGVYIVLKEWIGVNDVFFQEAFKLSDEQMEVLKKEGEFRAKCVDLIAQTMEQDGYTMKWR